MYLLIQKMEGADLMPRGENQKLKLLYLKQFFEEETDEDHPATMPDILAYLDSKGIHAERKSI